MFILVRQTIYGSMLIRVGSGSLISSKTIEVMDTIVWVKLFKSDLA